MEPSYANSRDPGPRVRAGWKAQEARVFGNSEQGAEKASFFEAGIRLESGWKVACHFSGLSRFLPGAAPVAVGVKSWVSHFGALVIQAPDGKTLSIRRRNTLCSTEAPGVDLLCIHRRSSAQRIQPLGMPVSAKIA